MSTPTKTALTLATVALVVVGCLIGALLAEGGYRAYLRLQYPARFTLPDRESYIASYSVSHWEFDEQLGYVYPPNRAIDYTGVADGRVRDCDRFSVIDKNGNIGLQKRDFADADLKVAVFGDSWSAFQQGGKTWPYFLQEELEKRLGRKVAVMNFGRDGTGVLQMFDMAAAKIAQWKPDISIVAFISDDLTRARFWRTVVGSGDAQRVLTTTDPVPNPRLDRATDTYLLMHSATYEWCRKMQQAKESDDVLRELILKHRRLIARSGEFPMVASVWRLDRSFLFDRLRHGNPYWTLDREVPPSANPRINLRSYADDARFTVDLAKVKATGSRLVLFHLAFYPEIKANREYILDTQQQSLLDSLEKATGKSVRRTTDFVEMPVSQPERMNVSADNYHPSLWGMQFYASAIANMLLREGYVK